MDPIDRLSAHREALRELVLCVDDLERFRVDLFADRETVADALSYAYSMNDPAVTTAVHVLLNTVIKQLTSTRETVV